MDDIFGVVQDYGLEHSAGARLLFLHGAPEEVETVRLGRGTRPVVDTDYETVVLIRDRVDGRQSGKVIGIDADENAIVADGPLVECIAQHRADHIGFTPGGNEDAYLARL